MFSYSFTYTAQTLASGFDIVGFFLAELYSHLNNSFASESNGPFALSSQTLKVQEKVTHHNTAKAFSREDAEESIKDFNVMMNLRKQNNRILSAISALESHCL